MATNKTDSFDAFSKTLTGVIAAAQANLAATRQIPIGGQSVSVSSLIADFQDYVTKNTAVDAAKASTQVLVNDRKALKVTTKQQLEDFSKWIVLQFGSAALPTYGLPAAKPRTTSPAKQAIGVEKRKAKSQAKANAKAALATPQETIVAFNGDGTPIGGAPAVPASPVASAVPTPAPTASSSATH